jgi:hypothetical protein
MTNAIAELETFKSTTGKFPMSSMIEAVNVNKETHLYLWSFRSQQLWDDTDSRVVTHGITLRAALEFLHKMGCEVQSVIFE